MSGDDRVRLANGQLVAFGFLAKLVTRPRSSLMRYLDPSNRPSNVTPERWAKLESDVRARFAKYGAELLEALHEVRSKRP